MNHHALDEHFTPKEIAARWRVSEKTVIRQFQDMAGVLKIGDPNPRGKRAYVTLRIPRAIVERFYLERAK